MTSPKLLRIDASARLTGSYSRRLGDLVEAQWKAAHPNADRVHRDLAHAAPPHIAEATIHGFYAPHEQLTPALRAAVALSDTLVTELRQCDTLLIASPMYNFGTPSSLKAWIDQVVRVGQTFRYGPHGPEGLLDTRLAVLALVSGIPGTLGGPVDHVSPHLEDILRFLGVKEVVTLHVDGTSGSADHVEAAMDAAVERSRSLFTKA